jgi:hypothetical protein
VPEQGIPGELLDQVVATITANREHWLDTAARPPRSAHAQIE